MPSRSFKYFLGTNDDAKCHSKGHLKFLENTPVEEFFFFTSLFPIFCVLHLHMICAHMICAYIHITYAYMICPYHIWIYDTHISYIISYVYIYIYVYIWYSYRMPIYDRARFARTITTLSTCSREANSTFFYFWKMDLRKNTNDNTWSRFLPCR